MKTCIMCGQQFQPHKFVKRWQKFCSLACQRQWYQAKQPPAICQGCGKTFIPKGTDRRKYCSRECFFEYRRKHPKNSGLNPIVIYINVCKVCGKTFIVQRKGVSICSDECRLVHNRNHSLMSSQRRDKRNRKPRPCAECGKIFVPEYGNKRRRYCSVRCQYQYCKRIGGATRHARERKARIEFVDPIGVFQAAGWRCQLCGVKTPRNKRGTYENSAPELDHIIPLAFGGAHAYYNVQCVCRKCNQEKGARTLGQLQLAM